MANESKPETRRPRLPRQDTVDFATAFTVGAVLGVGATLLLTPETTRTERVAKRLRPPTRQIRRSIKQAREALEEGGEAAGDLSSELIGAGRELIGEFRAEVARIVEDARADLQDAIRDASGQRRRSRRRFGA